MIFGFVLADRGGTGKWKHQNPAFTGSCDVNSFGAALLFWRCCSDSLGMEQSSFVTNEVCIEKECSILLVLSEDAHAAADAVFVDVVATRDHDEFAFCWGCLQHSTGYWKGQNSSLDEGFLFASRLAEYHRERCVCMRVCVVLLQIMNQLTPPVHCATGMHTPLSPVPSVHGGGLLFPLQQSVHGPVSLLRRQQSEWVHHFHSQNQ
jgi:hypothetical protein